MMKLLRLCAAWAALISLSGCGDRKPEPNSANAQTDGPSVVDGAFFPHEGDASSGAASAAASDSASADPGDPTLLNAVRKQEAPALKANADLALRNGDVLTIRTGGRDIARFTDRANLYCRGDNSCTLWTFAGTVSAGDGHGHKTAYPMVLHDNSEETAVAVVESNGRLVWLNDVPMPSPDGRFLAIQENEDLSGGVLTVIDWLSPGHANTVAFNGQDCKPLKWNSGTALQVQCVATDGKQQLPATVGYDGKAWHLAIVIKQATRGTRKAKAHPAIVKTFDAAAETAWGPQQRADADAADRADGYERLALPDGP